MITTIFCAPFTEEVAKYIAVKKDTGGKYFLIFGFLEFFIYIARLLSMDLPLSMAMIVRTPALLMHGITTYIMYRHRQDAPNHEKDSKAPLAAGMMIHFFFNLAVAPILTVLLSNQS